MGSYLSNKIQDRSIDFDKIVCIFLFFEKDTGGKWEGTFHQTFICLTNNNNWTDLVLKIFA